MHTIDDSRDYFFEHLLYDSAIQWEKNGTFGTKLKKEFPLYQINLPLFKTAL